VATGTKTLVVLVEASQASAALQLIELCADGSRQVLRPFIFDPSNPAKGYRVLGVEA